MATTKKSTAKRSSATKPKTTKKTTPRKNTTAKRSTTTKRTSASKSTRTRRSKPAAIKSFHVAKPDEPFMSLRITVQTLYWLILSGAVLMLGLWVLNIHNKVQTIYDEIDRNTVIQQELDAKELEMLREKGSAEKADS